MKTKTVSASQLISPVVRKPLVVVRWILTSYWFYLAIVLIIILMNTAVPSMVDAALAKIYPQIETTKLFGLIVQKSDDPRILGQRKIILGVFWAIAWGITAWALLLSLPGVVRKTTSKARNSESKADALVASKPSESILLYNRALKYAVDQDYESTLKNKIDSLDDLIKTRGFDAPSTQTMKLAEAKGTGTMVLPKKDASDKAGQGNLIGPDGRYRIEKQLGQGAMGIVYLATDQILLREVALKKLPSGANRDQKVIDRFHQEARALAQLSHPHIVQIYDFVQEENQYWIAMEFVEGTDLGGLIERQGKFAVDEALGLFIPIAEAMDYAHHRGVVHRDFKPSNVLINKEGNPKVMDFGLAKLSHSTLATMEGSLLGSPAFMSPEQARGETADHRSDIYAMGIALYQVLTGKLPFEGDLKTVITQKIANRPPAIKAVEEQAPVELVRIIKKMIAIDPNDRHTSMKDISHELKTFAATNS